MLPSLDTLMRCSKRVLQSPLEAAASQMRNGHSKSAAVGIYGPFTPDNDLSCSGRGDCVNNTCVCDIRYAGNECDIFNLPYYAGISTVFYVVALVSVIQLLICIVAEYQRLKQPSVLRACRITTQKLLYFMVFVAASLRGAYFTTPVSKRNPTSIGSFDFINLLAFQLDLQPQWAVTLMSAYYPLLMTCASLIVCMWAEVSPR